MVLPDHPSRHLRLRCAGHARRDGRGSQWRASAVVVSNKTGLISSWTRRTANRYDVKERPVPKGDACRMVFAHATLSGETSAVHTPKHHARRDRQSDAGTAEILRRLWDAEGGAHNDGPFTPVGMKPTVVFPGQEAAATGAAPRSIRGSDITSSILGAKARSATWRRRRRIRRPARARSTTAAPCLSAPDRPGGARLFRIP